jgi:hypothetical protein
VTRDHPDWGSDAIAKDYFREAAGRKFVPFYFENDEGEGEERYRALINNERK